MGFWGTALYSGDFAMDLRATISAVAHLPFETERIVGETELSAANNSADDDDVAVLQKLG
jgi:hypothetical protein